MTGVQPSTGPRRKFDIVFMDIQMPVMDGCEAAVSFGTSADTVPIIALTLGPTRG